MLGFTYADTAGNYSLNLPGTVELRASLKGRGWEVWDIENQAAPFVAPPITQPVSQPDFVFNPSPTEQTTAYANAHVGVGVTWEYYRSRLGSEPSWLDDTVLALTNSVLTCNGLYNIAANAIVFSKKVVDPICANHAYSTIASHEYAHSIMFRMSNIGWVEGQKSFHEGFADTVAHLVFDTSI